MLKGKKKESDFKLMDFVVVRGKKVKCRCSDINTLLGSLLYFMHNYANLIKKKKLEDMRVC